MKTGSTSRLLNWGAVAIWIGAAAAALLRQTPEAIQGIKKRLPIHRKEATGPKS